MTALHWTHAVRDVPAAGLPVDRIATAEERQQLAGVLDVLSVDALSVAYRLRPAAGGRLSLAGRIAARITQACVVTLDPVATELALDLDVVFVPGDGGARDARGPSELEVSHEDLEAPDEEPIDNGVVDIGRVIVEELMSGLDPYPRKPGVSFDWKDDKAAAAATHPFAALARLGRKQGEPEA
ncbi:MAG: DUF177 domain-containing protein [Hyphomicrobiaceae bacterium]